MAVAVGVRRCAIALFAAAIGAADGTTQSYSVAAMGEPLVVGREMFVFAADLAPDGSVFAIDFGGSAVIRFAPDGQVLWRVGRKGRGPGEFEAIYRVSVGPDTVAHVFDRADQSITTITKDGHVIARRLLPLRFYQVGSIVALNEGRLAIAGVAVTDDNSSKVAKSAVHVFDKELKRLTSFGPLASVREVSVLRLVGTGSASRAGSGNELLYTRSYPYEVYRFKVDGRLVSTFKPPIVARVNPDAMITVRQPRPGDALAYRVNSGSGFLQPQAVIELANGMMIGGRASARETWQDTFERDGKFVGSTLLPAGRRSAFGFDAKSQSLWTFGDFEGERVILKQRVDVVRK